MSGHGVLSQSRRFYFATATTALKLLRATAIEDSFVNDVMQHSRARSIVLVLDCCHSGAFGKGLTPKSALTVDVEHRFEGQGRVTLSASTELEYAFEAADPATGINELDRGRPGLAVHPLPGRGAADRRRRRRPRRQLSVDDLYDYVCRRVRERSPHQTPGMAGDMRGEIVIARSRRRAELPEALQEALASPLAGVRAGAVTELAALLGSRNSEAAPASSSRLAQDSSERVRTPAEDVLDPPEEEQDTVVLPPVGEDEDEDEDVDEGEDDDVGGGVRGPAGRSTPGWRPARPRSSPPSCS